MEEPIKNIKFEVVTVFNSFNEWVNKAASRMGGISRHSTLICLDKNGNECMLGEQFMYARDNDLFPVTAYRLIKNTEGTKD